MRWQHTLCTSSFNPVCFFTASKIDMPTSGSDAEFRRPVTTGCSAEAERPWPPRIARPPKREPIVNDL
jgi:hypothetical protein